MLRRRKWCSHPKGRSTTQRLGRTANPFCESLRRTILQTQRAGAEAGGHPFLEFGAGVSAVGPDVCEGGKRGVDLIGHQCGPIAVLDVRVGISEFLKCWEEMAMMAKQIVNTLSDKAKCSRELGWEPADTKPSKQPWRILADGVEICE